MNTGTISEINERLSGFIKRPHVKDGLFFHSDDLINVSFTALKKGDRVLFDIVENKNGSYATQIRRATDS